MLPNTKTREPVGSIKLVEPQYRAVELWEFDATLLKCDNKINKKVQIFLLDKTYNSLDVDSVDRVVASFECKSMCCFPSKYLDHLLQRHLEGKVQVQNQ